MKYEEKCDDIDAYYEMQADLEECSVATELEDFEQDDDEELEEIPEDNLASKYDRFFVSRSPTPTGDSPNEPEMTEELRRLVEISKAQIEKEEVMTGRFKQVNSI